MKFLGSSPAKYLSLSDLIKVHDSIEKMAIVHQIAVEPLCKVEDLRRQYPNIKLHEAVKSNMQKAFWDLLHDDLSKKPPEKMTTAFSLIVDLKTVRLILLFNNSISLFLFLDSMTIYSFHLSNILYLR